MKRTSIALLAAAALALSITACSGGAQEESAYVGDIGSPDIGAAEDMAVASDEGWEGGEPIGAGQAELFEAGYDPSSLAAAEAGDASQHIIVTGSVSVLTDSPVEKAEQFSQSIDDLGGFVENRWQHNDGRGTYVTVTARIPADQYAAAEGAAADLGKVEARSMDRADVGAAVADLQARKQALEDSLQRLKVLVEEAESVSELLEAEQMQTERQAELDGLVAQLDWYEDQVAMSTLSATFSTVPDVEGGFSWARAVQMLRASVEYVGYGLVIIIPWVAVLGGIAFLVRYLRKRR